MRKHRPDFLIFLASLGLIIASTIVIFAVGPRVAETKGYSSNYYMMRHIPFAIISVIVMIFMATDWQNAIAKMSRKFLKKTISIPKNDEILEKFTPALLIISGALCALIVVLGYAGVIDCTLGACRSFSIFGFGFQAVEMFKFAIMLYIANIIAKRRREGTFDKKEMWVPVAAILAFTLLVICAGQKDLGSTVVILFMVGLMLFVADVSWKSIAVVAGAIAVAVVPLIVFFPHRIQRLLGFTENYHLSNSLVGIGTGGWFGVGLGNSVQTVGYLPEALTDSIFSVICESWGFVGAVLILSLYVLLLWRILRVARHTEDERLRLIVVAVFAWILAHVIMNVGGMTGIIPMKGITLSFLSYGGMSLVFTGAAVGTVLYISGWTRREEVINENSSSRRGERRTRDAGYRRRS